MKILLVAGLAAVALAPPASAGTPSNVSVRVEGTAETLLPRAPVRTTPQPVAKDGDPAHACSGTSAIGALEVATNGRWDGNWSQWGQSVESILGEAHGFESGRYWTFWNNYEYQQVGACDLELQEGDEVLFAVGCFGDCTSPAPMRLTSFPRRAVPGEQVEVNVAEFAQECDANWNCTTSSGPAAGATVRVGGQAATTDGDGIARLKVSDRGTQDMRATKKGFIPTASETVCVTDGADGFCGTTRPGEAPKPNPAPPCETDGADGRCGTTDARPPVGRILGIKHGRQFKRKRAPRLLRGTVDPDPSGLEAVELRLTRRHKGRCWGFSGRLDRFVRTPCGKTWRFRIGDRADWSYLLPRRLPRGRYVVAVRARDRAKNLDPIEVGRNWVAFRVR